MIHRSDVILSLERLREGPRLEVYTDVQENRPLTLNYDLDPDDNYFINRPMVSKYSTPSALETVFSSNGQLTSLMHINSRSMASKTSIIACLLNQLSIDILAITETWLEESTTDSTQITGYSLIHKVRSTGRGGGGVGFAIKNHIKYSEMEIPTNCRSHLTYEALLLRFPQADGSYFVIGVVYRPPGTDVRAFNDEFVQLLSVLTTKTRDIYILGDFNIDLLKAQDHPPTSKFLDIMSSHHFLPSITQPTRITTTSSTLIENIFSNRTSKVVDSYILASDISDHLPILARINLTPIAEDTTANLVTRNINAASCEQFKTLLSQVDWSVVSDSCAGNDPDSSYDLFLSLFKTAYNTAFPLKKQKLKAHGGCKQPWMTPGLLKSCRKKSKLYLKFIKNPSHDNKSKFVTYRNKFKTIRIRAERKYYESEFLKYSHDLKKTWQVIRTIINTKDKNRIISNLCINGNSISDADVMSEKFNNYFANVAQDLVEKIPASNNTIQTYLDTPLPTSFAIYPTSPAELISINHTLKISHSAGFDEIDPTVVSPVFDLIAAPLSDIINCSLSSGIVPSALKIAKVLPIYKQGQEEELTNYRPI